MYGLPREGSVLWYMLNSLPGLIEIYVVPVAVDDTHLVDDVNAPSGEIDSAVVVWLHSRFVSNVRSSRPGRSG